MTFSIWSPILCLIFGLLVSWNTTAFASNCQDDLSDAVEAVTYVAQPDSNDIVGIEEGSSVAATRLLMAPFSVSTVHKIPGSNALLVLSSNHARAAILNSQGEVVKEFAAPKAKFAVSADGSKLFIARPNRPSFFRKIWDRRPSFTRVEVWDTQSIELSAAFDAPLFDRMTPNVNGSELVMVAHQQSTGVDTYHRPNTFPYISHGQSFYWSNTPGSSTQETSMIMEHDGRISTRALPNGDFLFYLFRPNRSFGMDSSHHRDHFFSLKLLKAGAEDPIHLETLNLNSYRARALEILAQSNTSGLNSQNVDEVIHTLESSDVLRAVLPHQMHIELAYRSTGDFSFVFLTRPLEMNGRDTPRRLVQFKVTQGSVEKIETRLPLGRIRTFALSADGRSALVIDEGFSVNTVPL